MVNVLAYIKVHSQAFLYEAKSKGKKTKTITEQNSLSSTIKRPRNPVPFCLYSDSFLVSPSTSLLFWSKNSPSTRRGLAGLAQKKKSKQISKATQKTDIEKLASHSIPLTVRAQQISSRQANTARPSHWDRRAQVHHRGESGPQRHCPNRQAACWSQCRLFRPLWMWVSVGALWWT